MKKTSGIVEQIRKIAKQMNISNTELSKRMDRSRQSIYDCYSGKVGINIELLNSFANALGHKVEINIIPKLTIVHSPTGVKVKELLCNDEIAKLKKPLKSMGYLLEKQLVNLSVAELSKLFEVVYKSPIIQEKNTSIVALAYNELANRAMEKDLQIFE